MTFFERYSDICVQQGIEPCSQRAADLFGTTRATISTWGKNNSTPRGETVRQIADGLRVSTDYLLGRTEDPTDYARTGSAPQQPAPVPDVDIMPKPATNDADTDLSREEQRILRLFGRLDAIDRVRVESYIEGILTGDKYKNAEESLA